MGKYKCMLSFQSKNMYQVVNVMDIIQHVYYISTNTSLNMEGKHIQG